MLYQVGPIVPFPVLIVNYSPLSVSLLVLPQVVQLSSLTLTSTKFNFTSDQVSTSSYDNGLKVD